MSADAPRLGYALWDLVHALATTIFLLSPLLALVGVAWVALRDRQ